MKKIILFFALGLSSCTLGTIKNKTESFSKKTSLDQKKKSQIMLERDSQRFNKDKNHKMLSSTQSKASIKNVNYSVSYRPQTKKLLLESKNSSVNSEHISLKNDSLKSQQREQFMQIKDAYEQKNFEKFYQLSKAIEKDPLLEPSLKVQLFYLKALVAYQRGRYGEGLKYFDQVLELPQAHRQDRAKALFAKAKIYQKMNIQEQSQDIYEKLIKEYPDTLEAHRAQVELRSRK